jgi:hypothetical protein
MERPSPQLFAEAINAGIEMVFLQDVKSYLQEHAFARKAAKQLGLPEDPYSGDRKDKAYNKWVIKVAKILQSKYPKELALIINDRGMWQQLRFGNLWEYWKAKASPANAAGCILENTHLTPPGYMRPR